MITILPTTTTTSVSIGPLSQPGNAGRRDTARVGTGRRRGAGRRSGDGKGDPLAGCEYLFGCDYTSRCEAYQAIVRAASRSSLLVAHSCSGLWERIELIIPISMCHSDGTNPLYLFSKSVDGYLTISRNSLIIFRTTEYHSSYPERWRDRPDETSATLERVTSSEF
jgi:hypothetical protein